MVGGKCIGRISPWRIPPHDLPVRMKRIQEKRRKIYAGE
jgi:hypothetical protein